MTAALAEYVVAGTYDDLPAPVVSALKNSILDGIGVALAGAQEPVGQEITAFVDDLGGRPRASVLASDLKTSPPNAALANGTLIHALDYDDGIQIFSFHCTSVLLPAILAVGEERGTSGREVIAAFAYGFETAAVIFRSTNRKDYDLGWHRTATVGTLAAAAAAGHVLGLNAEQMRVALGIAASQASGIRQNFGTMTKPLHSGLAARNGVTAAMLAERGFTADPNILEGKLGLLNVLIGEGNYDTAKMMASLERPFDYISSLRIKKYPCCGQNTRPVDTMLSLVREYDLQPEQVAQVTCGVSPSVMNILIHAQPSTGLEGKFSLEFCLAMALLYRQVTLDQFTDERVQEPLMREYISKISKYPDETVPHSGGKGPTVEIQLQDGRTLTRRLDMEKDQPWAPQTREDQIIKFRDCASRALPTKRVDAALELLSDLENVQDIRQVLTVVTETDSVRTPAFAVGG